MVLKDTAIATMTAEDFWSSARSKIVGAWNLHCLTQTAPLDYFVVYSSVTAVAGNPGQANYAAGNLFMEALVHQRRALGLCGTAIEWGAISDTGYLTGNPSVRETLEKRLCVRPYTARRALRYLEQILAHGGAHWIAADADWSRLASSLAAVTRSPRFSALLGERGSAETPGTVEDMRARLEQLSQDEARQAVTEILSKELARVLGAALGRIDPDRPMGELGVDSLMAVELLTAIDTRFHASVTSLDIAGGATVSQIAGRIVAAIQVPRADGEEHDK
jgi:acyl carrier protein